MKAHITSLHAMEILDSRIQIVGDDLCLTNTQFIARGIAEKSTNAVLIKLNQIGTVTETIEAIHLCRKAGWGFVISHRSGETEDAFMADFAVAMGGGQIKSGSAGRKSKLRFCSVPRYDPAFDMGHYVNFAVCCNHPEPLSQPRLTMLQQSGGAGAELPACSATSRGEPLHAVRLFSASRVARTIGNGKY